MLSDMNFYSYLYVLLYFTVNVSIPGPEMSIYEKIKWRVKITMYQVQIQDTIQRYKYKIQRSANEEIKDLVFVNHFYVLGKRKQFFVN